MTPWLRSSYERAKLAPAMPTGQRPRGQRSQHLRKGRAHTNLFMPHRVLKGPTCTTHPPMSCRTFENAGSTGSSQRALGGTRVSHFRIARHEDALPSRRICPDSWPFGRFVALRLSRTTASVVRFGNDPSAGSPTETLLRLLLPLDSQV